MTRKQYRLSLIILGVVILSIMLFIYTGLVIITFQQHGILTGIFILLLALVCLGAMFITVWVDVKEA